MKTFEEMQKGFKVNSRHTSWIFSKNLRKIKCFYMNSMNYIRNFSHILKKF